MSVLAGFGAFAGGVARGAQIGMQIEDMKQRRKEKAANQKAMDAFFSELEKKNAPQTGLDAVKPTQDFSIQTNIDYTSGAGVMNAQPEQQPIQQAQAYPDYTPQRFADGGMVQDPNAFVNQVQATPQQSSTQMAGLSALQPAQQSTPKAPRKNPMQIASDLKDAYYAAAKVAHAEGGNDLAMQYMKLGFDQEDKIFKQEKMKAMNAFDLTSDVNALVPLYNDHIPDGHSITSAQQTSDGKYKLTIQTPQGNQVEQTYSKDDILGMASSIDDPATRFSLRAKALLESQTKDADAEREIKKQVAIKDAGLQELDPYKRYMKNNEVVQEPLQKPDAWKNNYQSVTGGYLQNDGQGKVGFVPTNASGLGGRGSGGDNEKNYNKEMLSVLKEVDDGVLGFDGMATLDGATGAKMPTAKGNQARVFGERLIKSNPDLLPSEAANLAFMAATDPSKVRLVRARNPNGETVEVQAIIDGDSIHILSSPNGVMKSPKQKEEIKQGAPASPNNTSSQPKNKQESNPKSHGLDSLVVNTKNQPYTFQDQIQSQPSSFDADAARAALGTGKKDWFEKKPLAQPSKKGLGDILPRDSVINRK